MVWMFSTNSHIAFILQKAAPMTESCTQDIVHPLQGREALESGES